MKKTGVFSPAISLGYQNPTKWFATLCLGCVLVGDYVLFIFRETKQ